MKLKEIITSLILITIATTGSAQVKVLSSGNMGIGTTTPNYKLDVYGSGVRFDYSNYPFWLKLSNSDPRICSDYRIIFYKTNQTGYIDIKVDDCIEYSDSSAKTDIRQIESARDIITQLNGVTFLKKDEISGIRRSGLIAQDVEKILPGVVFTDDSTGTKSISYTKIIPYLIESIKEQQDQITELTKEIEGLKASESSYKSEAASTPDTYSSNTNTSELLQNAPNPFNIDTRIVFRIDEEVSNSTIYLYDMQGSQIKSYDIQERGNSYITIHGSELNPGMYLYTLIVDGQEIDTKRMVLTEL